MSAPAETRKKTMKREIATCGLLYVALVGVAAIFLESTNALEVLKIVTVPAFAFAAAAFGMDEFSKNMRKDP